MGVKTVINLRDDFDPREALWVRDAGMEYLLITTNCRDIRPAQIATFMRRMREYQKDPQRWPVFVHCHYGKDRTGLYVAVWRIAEERWGRGEAINELTSYGHSPDNSLFCPHVAPYLRQFDPADLRGTGQ
jgi:protein tyrosine/serine phosphatase